MSETSERNDLPASNRDFLPRLLTTICYLVAWLVLVAANLWAIGAIVLVPWSPDWLPLLLGVLLAFATIMSFRADKQKHAAAVMLGSAATIYLATWTVQPSNQRNWAADQAKIAEVDVNAENITIRNFRNFRYRTDADFDESFETRSFRLQQIQSVWFILQKFTAGDRIAHVFVSFGIDAQDANQRYFSVSVEARREVGETYSPLAGIYRNYDLTHIIGDERDLIGVRTVHRPNDRVYMYRVNATPQEAQKLFLKFARRINKLHSRPRHYHTLLDNCVNGITHLTCGMTPEPIDWMDSRIMLPGFSDHYAFDHGLIGDKAGGQTFEETRRKARIDQIAKEIGIRETFSDNIRDRLPGG